MLRYCPNTVFMDRDLLPNTTTSKDGAEFGKVCPLLTHSSSSLTVIIHQLPQITSFTGNRATVRKADGALLTTSIPSHAPALYALTNENRWDEAVRLCR